MERLPLTGKNEDILVLDNALSERFVIDGQNVIKVKTNERSRTDLLILNLKDNSDLHFEVSDNSYLHVSVLAKNNAKSIKISANVGQNASFDAYFADFIDGPCKCDVDVNLNKENASCDWHLASLTENKDNKVFNVSVFHKAPHTFAKLDNYGVARDDGKLTFSGVCHILKGSFGSKAHQNAKVMVFDSLSNGVAKPILKIDENDIEASHAAIVGKINDEQIFYLTSRGLSEDEAKRIITLGYLKPILKGFDDEDMKESIEKMIEGNM